MPGRRVTATDVALIATCVVTSAGGQVLLRVGARAAAAHSAAATLASALLTPAVIAGIAVYALSSVFWLMVLSRVDLAIAYPLGASSYVLIGAAGALMGEAVSPLRVAGMAVIAVGVACIGVGSRR